MIELDLTLPLARFTLMVARTLAAPAVAVVGASGSGKTSLLEALAGLRPRARGRIAVDGVTLLDSARGVCLPPERRRVGYVPQDGALFPHLDARANVRFGLRHVAAERAAAERRADDAVRLLDLAPLLDRRPDALSGGERQRVALARALATGPRLLLLDEPLAALDAPLRERIVPWLVRVREALDVPLLYVTHSLGEAELVCTEALLLEEGQVLAHGAIAEVLPAPRLRALDPLARVDNLVAGPLAVEPAAATGRLALPDGTPLVVPLAASEGPAPRATFAVAADDILVATHPLDGVSARNVLAGRILSVEREPDGHGAILRVEAAGHAWRARVTVEAVAALALAEGRPVWLAVKTQSLARVG